MFYDVRFNRPWPETKRTNWYNQTLIVDNGVGVLDIAEECVIKDGDKIRFSRCKNKLKASFNTSTNKTCQWELDGELWIRDAIDLFINKIPIEFQDVMYLLKTYSTS